MEIDEYRDYEKALAALKEASPHPIEPPGLSDVHVCSLWSALSRPPSPWRVQPRRLPPAVHRAETMLWVGMSARVTLWGLLVGSVGEVRYQLASRLEVGMPTKTFPSSARMLVSEGLPRGRVVRAGSRCSGVNAQPSCVRREALRAPQGGLR